MGNRQRSDSRTVGLTGDDWEPTLAEIDRQDREDRDESWSGRRPGTNWRAAYVATLGETPTIQGGNREEARRYLRQVEEIIDRGGWTKSEQGRLYRMREKWQRRADGGDAVFNVVGNRKGGWTDTERAEIRRERANIAMQEMTKEVIRSGPK